MQDVNKGTATKVLIQKKATLWVVGSVIVVVGSALLLHFFPVGTLPYPPCPVHALTGLYCPGCGTTRAASALVNGNVLLAWRQNPLLIPAVMYLMWAWVKMLSLSVWYKSIPEKARVVLQKDRAMPKLLWSLLVGVIVWTVLRNIFPVLAPL